MLTGIFKKQVPKYPINPRFRAYGKARLDIARRAASGSDWDRLWKEPAFPFPFDWGEWWKQCIEYKVDDFPAEVGFYTDILGLPIVAFDPNYAMFTSPSQDFFLAVVPSPGAGKSTPPDALRIQFMVADIFDTVRELERRGIVFEQKPQPCEQGSSMFITYFRTPHGLCVDLWGVVQPDDRPYEDPMVGEEAFGIQDQEVESSGLSYQSNYQESTQDEQEELFAAEEEEAESIDEPALRFFVEPASLNVETDEAEETRPPGELNFGVTETESTVKKKAWHAGEYEEEEAIEEGDEEEDDSEDDESSPYEYIYVDDL